jgi:dTDP-4-dehydrorhamnose 3,5-epimerase
MIDGVIFTALPKIDTKGGNVLHAMKEGDPGFSGFGEAYFSYINSGSIKGWKLHNKMVLNLVVPLGIIRFVIFDNRKHSKTNGKFAEYVLSSQNYGRLTVPSGLWLGFQGLYDYDSLLLNIANICHDPAESVSKKIDEINYDWN